MAMNPVQFQRGLSMAEFMQCYGSDEPCEAALIPSRWPQGFLCPDCRCGVHSPFRREARLDWPRSACLHPCSACSGTLLASSKLGLACGFLATHLLTRRVEIDWGCSGGQVGRGVENKGSFVAAVQTPEDGPSELAALHQRSGVGLRGQVAGAPGDDGLRRSGLLHRHRAGRHPQAHRHDRRQGDGRAAAVSGAQHRAGPPTTGQAGTCHAFKFANRTQYAHRDLAEFQCRFNRRFDLRSTHRRFAHAACTTKPHSLKPICG